MDRNEVMKMPGSLANDPYFQVEKTDHVHLEMPRTQPTSIFQLMRNLATLEGHCSISNGALTMPDGATVDLNRLLDRTAEGSVRVLVTVAGGIADYVADEGVDVHVFDHDNYEDDPVGTEAVPEHFRDLAEPLNVPVAK